MWALLLGEEDNRHLVLVGRSDGGRPAPGSYRIESADARGWSVLHMVQDADELLGMFFGEEGTLTITESTSQVVKGTLEFEATGIMGDDPADISAIATFTAVPDAAVLGVSSR